MSVDLSYLVNVSIAPSPVLFPLYNKGNTALFTKETPINSALTLTNPGIYQDAPSVATDWGSNSEVYAQANVIFSQPFNLRTSGALLIIFPMASGDLFQNDVTATLGTIYYGSILVAGYNPSDAEYIAVAGIAQANRRLAWVSSQNTTALTGGGLFATIKGYTDTQARMILHTASAATARLLAAGACSWLMGTDFTGTATALTLGEKTIYGVPADTGITLAILGTATSPGTCASVGVDCYPIIAQGNRPTYISNGANGFADDVYNLNALAADFQVNLANILVGTNTKIPQTEQGMNVIKTAVIATFDQYVRNGYIAPGSWNGSIPFGDPATFTRQIAQLGYYVYSQPVNQQSAALRAIRQAPLIQTALKVAGAIQQIVLQVNTNQ